MCLRSMAPISRHSTVRSARSLAERWLAILGSRHINVLAGCRRVRFRPGSPIFLTSESPLAASSAGCPLALSVASATTRVSVYHVLWRVMSARSFQTPTGSSTSMTRTTWRWGCQPYSFLLYKEALGLMGGAPPAHAVFMFVYLAANHFPWERDFRTST